MPIGFCGARMADILLATSGIRLELRGHGIHLAVYDRVIQVSGARHAPGFSRNLSRVVLV